MTIDACRVCGSPCSICAERRAAADLSATLAELGRVAASLGPSNRESFAVVEAEFLRRRKP